MAEDNSNLGTPSWAEPHISNLAKIHDLFDSGSQKIRKFMKENSVTSEDYEKFKIIPGNNKDNFRKMIEDDDVEKYLESLKKLKKLILSMKTACGRNRPIAERFVSAVVNMEDIELPPKELFEIHDGNFPFDKKTMQDIITRNRRIRNQAEHIGDETTDVSQKAKNDWKWFLKLILPLKFNDIMKRFVESLQIIEFIEDGTREIIEHEYVETQMRKYTDKSLTFSEPELIKRALGANKWDKYIEVEHKQDFEGEAEEAIAINHLDFLMREESPNSVIEINGLGGLGKTKLAREYIRRSIDMDLKYRPKRYEHYIYYTAKSKKQGEIGATYDGPRKESPDNWKHGGGDYIENLVFDDFLEKVQKLFNLKSADLEERIIEYLARKRIFILLDNFEDVSNNDIPRYKKFFGKFPKNFDSRFVITSRRDKTYGGKSLILDRFNKTKAVEMLSARYEFEIQRNAGEAMKNRLIQLQTARDNEVDLIQEILDKVQPPENPDVQFLMNKETLEKNLRHPLYLRYLANLLVNPTLIERTKDKTGISDVLVHIIDEPQFKFWEWHEDVINWMLEHAFSKVEEYPHCVTVLKILLENESGIALADLFIEFQNCHPEVEKPVEASETSLKQIKSHREFLDERSDSSEFFLTSSAKKYLHAEFTPVPSHDNSENLNVVETANKNPVEPIDFASALKQVLEHGLKGPQNFVDAVYRLQEYSKQDTVDMDLVSEAEDKLSQWTKKLDLRDELAFTFLDFLQIMKDKKSRFDLICQQAEIYANNEVFETLGESDQSIASYLLGPERWPEHSGNGPENQHSGHILILLLRIEESGVQKNIQSLFSCIGDLLERLELDEMELLLEEYNFKEDFGDFLSERRQLLVWSEKKQAVFNNYFSNRTNHEKRIQSEEDDTRRFSTIPLENINKNWNLQFHRDGLQSLEAPHGRMCNVNWDLITQTLTVFVYQPNLDVKTDVTIVEFEVTKRVGMKTPAKGEVMQRERSILPPGDTPSGFEEWVTSSNRGHPGITVDPIELASDISMVCELYNQIFNATLVNSFARALNLKNIYKDYYRGSTSSHSAAFLIGFGFKDSRIEFADAALALKTQFEYLLDKEQKIFDSNEHKQEWKRYFHQLLDDAFAHLSPETSDEVGERIRMRKKLQLNGRTANPFSDSDMVRRARAAGKNNQKDSYTKKAVLTREECEIPNLISQALKKLQNNPFLTKMSLRKDLIQQGGLNLTIQAQAKMVADYNVSKRSSKPPKEWDFFTAWLDSTVEYIWSSSNTVVRKYIHDEDFIRNIEDTHFRKFSPK